MAILGRAGTSGTSTEVHGHETVGNGAADRRGFVADWSDSNSGSAR